MEQTNKKYNQYQYQLIDIWGGSKSVSYSKWQLTKWDQKYRLKKNKEE